MQISRFREKRDKEREEAVVAETGIITFWRTNGRVWTVNLHHDSSDTL
jgi:hypothetical protein